MCGSFWFTIKEKKMETINNYQLLNMKMIVMFVIIIRSTGKALLAFPTKSKNRKAKDI